MYKGTPEGAALYFVEAKTPQSDKDNLREAKEVQFPDRVRWSISQIILRIDYAQQEQTVIYGIASPKTELRCLLSLYAITGR